MTQEDLQKCGVRFEEVMKKEYKGSLYTALVKAYSEHNWVLWKFHHKPRGFWLNKEMQQQYVDWLGEQLGFKRMTDWYKLTADNISKYNGEGLLNYYGTPPKVLQSIFPEHNWLSKNFVK